MKVKVNDIIVHGKMKKLKEIGIRKTVNFYGNNLRIHGAKFSIHISKNISYIFVLNKVLLLLKKTIKKEYKHSKIQLSAYITNIQHSTRFRSKNSDIIEQLIPKINEQFHIDSIEATEEANISMNITLNQLTEGGNNFICFSIKSKETSSHIKFQQSKERSSSHCTLILGNFNQKTQDLIHLIESWCKK